MIKSYFEEDIHKAIKYNLWSSSKNGNNTLNNAFQNGGNVYLLFSCNKSLSFLGMAKMKSVVEYDKYFPYWSQDNKWGGVFSIEWVFIKDIPFKQFKDISITMRDGVVRPVTFSKDAQEVPFTDGKKLVEIFENYNNTNSILEHFEYYDIRQENYERMNPIQKIQQKISSI
jgi:hypothetical protein